MDPAMREEPSTYVVDLLIEKIRYTYGFSVDDTRVTEEWMYSYPRGRKRKIFHRDLDTYEPAEHSPESMKQVQEITESNVLFLSVAARSKQDLVRPVYDWFDGVLDRNPLMMRLPRSTESLNRFGYLDRLTSLLRAADTGIESAEIVDETDAEFAERTARRGGIARQGGTEGYPLRRRKDVFFQHRGENGTFPLGLRDQSFGTRALYEMGLPVFRSLDRGTLLIVDELDASLHPYLSAQLVKLFREPSTNPLGAQLIFTSHDATLLGRIQGEEVLHRDHVWFTEKDECGATELFSLSEFKPRRDENRERRYMTGRYGAVPIVNDEVFATALSRRGEAGDVPPDTQVYEDQH
ncbi:ATP/GTP-binding protein [Streptosporangium lutulentum]